MKIDQLLRDVTDSVPGTSQNAQEVALHQLLVSQYGADCISMSGISKWFERGRIPGPWLLKIASLPNTPINLASYI